MSRRAKDRKYELIKSSKTDTGLCEVFRIRAVRDFGDVRAGDVGGYVEGEENLSHEGHAWVGDDAMVTAGGRVRGNAVVCDHAWVSGASVISGKAVVGGWAEVKGRAVIAGEAYVWSPCPDPGPVAIRPAAGPPPSRPEP